MSLYIKKNTCQHYHKMLLMHTHRYTRKSFDGRMTTYSFYLFHRKRDRKTVIQRKLVDDFRKEIFEPSVKKKNLQQSFIQRETKQWNLFTERFNIFLSWSLTAKLMRKLLTVGVKTPWKRRNTQPKLVYRRCAPQNRRDILVKNEIYS